MKKHFLLFTFTLISTWCAFAQTNLGFENWSGNEPTNWVTFNGIPGAAQSTFKETTNPGQGTSSAKLVTISCPTCSNFFLSDPLGGMVTLGSSANGIPYTQKPTSVDFRYKSNPATGDMGGFAIQLTRWNGSTQERDVIGEAWFTSQINVNTWTNVNLPIAYNSALLPDSLVIFATSSIGNTAIPAPGIPAPVVGSVFYIDAINLNLPSCDGFTISASATAETSLLANDGTATVNPSGGAAPYTYLWSNLATTQSISGLIPGIYYVTVTDANGCVKTATCNVLVGGCNGLAVTVTGANATSITANNGSAAATVTGGTPPYTYLWNTGATTASMTGLDVGAYAVSVRDNSPNCMQIGGFTVLLGTTAIEDITDKARDLRSYPNPTDGMTHFSFTLVQDAFVNLSVYDLAGKKITQLVDKKLFPGEQSIVYDAQDLPNGIYYYILTIDKAAISQKFAVMK